MRRLRRRLRMAGRAIDAGWAGRSGMTARAGDRAGQVHRRCAQRMDVGPGNGERGVIEARGAAARMTGETTRGICGHYGDLDRGVTGDDAVDRLVVAADTGALPEVLRPGFVGPRRGVTGEAWLLVMNRAAAHVEGRVQRDRRDMVRRSRRHRDR